uniref:Uncharacterized protein n=1 Tax=Heterorhabditis bacteriophora TaxID=37862 RepID=A0A1I7WYC6_HETBA
MNFFRLIQNKQCAFIMRMLEPSVIKKIQVRKHHSF